MIRHPVTLDNIAGKTGHCLAGELSPEGYRQLDRLLIRLDYEKFDSIYSSDAYRCKVMADKIGENKRLTPIYSETFREINNGDWSGMTKQDVDRLRSVDPLNIRPPNGESLRDLVERANSAWTLINQTEEDRKLLISSGLFLKVFLGIKLGIAPVDALKKLKFSNCAMSEIRLTPEGCVIEYLNNRDYLN